MTRGATADSAALADLAEQAATDAAALIRQHSRAGVDVADTKTSQVDIVTAADREAEDLIRSRILAARPDDAFLGEEGDDIPGTSGVRWIVDPIDGTVNFYYGRPEHAVSIAAEVDGIISAGVVYDIGRSRVFRAHTEPGSDAGRAGRIVSTCDGQALAVRPPAPLAERLIATGFSYRSEVRVRQGAAVARLLPQIRDLRRLGSCALDLCQVADGTIDGYVEEGVNLWDHAAGGLIARGAGARFEAYSVTAGTTAVVCGPDHGFEELLAAVRGAGFIRE